jgi:hypothetical protein
MVVPFLVSWLFLVPPHGVGVAGARRRDVVVRAPVSAADGTEPRRPGVIRAGGGGRYPVAS